MATITISDLSPIGSDLFTDQESYLSALSVDDELKTVGGNEQRLIVKGFPSTLQCLIEDPYPTTPITEI
jgi:hypothetical protein